MSPSQFRELERQAEVIERDKCLKLWNEFKIENPNSDELFRQQFVAFEWLYKSLVTEKEKHINSYIL